jgi:SAM-dependent methyltransferase
MEFIAIGVSAGILAGLFGIGGGVVIVPALLLVAKMAPDKATGTSLAALLLPVGALGAWRYYRLDLVDLRGRTYVVYGLTSVNGRQGGRGAEGGEKSEGESNRQEAGVVRLHRDRRSQSELVVNDYSPVADLYDLYVQATFDLAFFEAEVHRAGGPVLELMAGTGRVSRAIAPHAPRLTCVDRSASMLRRLTAALGEQRPSPRVICADVVALPLERAFALAIFPFNSFAELVSPGAQAAALREAHRVLRDGGRLIVTLHNPLVRRRTLGGEPRLLGRFPRPAGGSLEVWARDTHTGTRTVACLQTYRLFDGVGALERAHQLTIVFALIEPAELVGLAEAAGFRVVARYGDYDRSPFDPATSPFFICELARGATALDS